MTGDMSCCLLSRWGTRHRFLPAPEDLNDTHGAAATRARFAQGELDDLDVGCWHGGLFGALDELEEQTAVMQSRMAEASRLVLDGFELGSDAGFTRYPEAFGNRLGPLWELVSGVIEGRP